MKRANPKTPGKLKANPKTPGNLKAEACLNKDLRKRYEKVIVKCEFCGETFNTNRSYQDHAQQEHAEQMRATWSQCSQCDELLPNKLALITHRAKIHGNAELRDANGKLACDFCERAYKNMLDLNKHCLKDHYDVIKTQWLPCSDCNLYFRNERGLRCHVKQRHAANVAQDKQAENSPHIIAKISSSEPAKECVRCSFCSKSFASPDKFYKHANTYHKEDVAKRWTFNPDQKMFYPKTVKARKKYKSLSKIQCSFCQKTFTHSDNFHQHANRYHLEEIEKDWIYDSAHKLFHPNARKEPEKNGIWCEFCSKELHYTLVPHANKQHYDIISKIWPNCQECDMYFPTSESLHSHNLVKHKLLTRQHWRKDLASNRKKVVKCEFCSEMFLTGRGCWRHAQKEHLEKVSQAWLKCPECNLYLPNSHVLNCHKSASHSKNKIPGDASPKKNCEFCPRKFFKSFLCTQHANKQHHNLIQGTWHKCPLCNFYLQTEKGLAVHKRRHKEFHMNNVSCSFCNLKFKTAIACVIHANGAHAEKVGQEWKFCDLCSKFFPADKHKHFLSKSCMFCPLVVRTQRSNILHCNKEHLKEISGFWLQCDLCLKYLPNDKLLNLHKAKNCSKLKEDTSRKRLKTAQHRDEHAENNYSTRSKRSRLVNIEAKHQERDPEEADSKNNDLSNIGVNGEELQVIEDDLARTKHTSPGSFLVFMTVESNKKENWDEAKLEHQVLEVDNSKAAELDEESYPQSGLKKSAKKKEKQTKSPLETEGSTEINAAVLMSNDFEIVHHTEEVVTCDFNDQNYVWEIELIGDDIDATQQFDSNNCLLDNIDTLAASKSENAEISHHKMHVTNCEVVTIDESMLKNAEILSQSNNEYPVISRSKPHVTMCEDQVQPKWPLDIAKVDLEPEDMNDFKKQHSKPCLPHEESFGNRRKYQVPLTATNIKLVTVVNKKGVETKRVQCEYCPKTHINVQVYNIHVNADHLDLAKLYWVQCDSCPRYFPNKFTLIKHRQVSHPVASHIERLLCDFCSTTHVNYASLYQHANKKHVDSVAKNWFACKVCNFYLPNTFSLASHVQQQHPKYHTQVTKVLHPEKSSYDLFCCELCDKTFYSRDGLRDHLKSKHANETTLKETTTLCAFCPDTFANSDLYFKHASSLHKTKIEENNWISCPSCGLKVPSYCMQIIHKRLCLQIPSESIPKIKCTHCQESFVRRGDFHTHANVAHKDLIEAANWYLCAACDKYVPQEFANYHRQFCKESEVDSDSNSNVESQISKKIITIQCQFCVQTFTKRQSSYLTHANRSHRAEIAAANWTLCQACDKYIIPESFFSHLTACQASIIIPGSEDGSSIQCQFCCQSFNGRIKNTYVSHANRFHRDEITAANWTLCNACDKYIIPESFDHHVSVCKAANIHNKIILPMQCQFCEQIFSSQKSNYYKHANQFHRSEIAAANWILCQICHKYIFPETFKNHLTSCKSSTSGQRATSGSKSVGKQACPTCLKLFLSKAQLHAHVDSCITNGGQLNCVYCPSDFSSKNKLNAHLNKFHREKLLESNWVGCEQCSQLFKDDLTLKSHRSRCQKRVIKRAKPSKLSKPPPNREKNIQCSFCSSVSTNNSKYYQHANKSHPEMVATWLTCLKCNFRFPQKVALRHHRRQCMTEKKKARSKKAKQFPCQFCNRVFEKSYPWIQHCRAEHPDDIKSIWQPCSNCRLLIPSDPKFLVRHLGMCNKLVKPSNAVPCDFCSEHFFRIAKYTVHANEVHEIKVAESLWPLCTKCNKYIPKMWKMSRHQESCKGL